MQLTAQDIITRIANQTVDSTDIPSMSRDDLALYLDALEDGAMLAGIGIGDDDQEAVEEAHAMIALELSRRTD